MERIKAGFRANCETDSSTGSGYSFWHLSKKILSEALTTFSYTNPDHQRCKAIPAAKVYLDYADFIKKLILLKIQDDDKADDILQDFFLALVSNPLPSDVQNIELYLQKAISNDIVEAIRKKRRYWNFIHEYAECNNHFTNGKKPETAAMEVEEANRIFELVEKKLPPSEAQAVCSRYRDDLSNKKIAEKMNVHPKTARGYVCEGLGRIRTLLKDLDARTSE